MEVILKQDIPSLGYKNDLIKVKAGYARNYLIPKGLAILATETNKKVLAEVIRQKSFKEEKIKKEAEDIAKALEGLDLKIGAKSGTSGKIFGSVNAVQIANAIKEDHNMEIDARYGEPNKLGIPAIVVLDKDGTQLFTQETGSLAFPEDHAQKGHDPVKVMLFLEKWAL